MVLLSNLLANTQTKFVFLQILGSLNIQKHSPKTTNIIQEKYDYIIVGAGSAGSTLAARLSEEPCVSVLLLEAGPSPPLLTEVPILSRLFLDTYIDWRYYTTPQKYAGDSLHDKQLYFPSGKAIGGSSIINAMFYVRGDRRVYDSWAEGGATGWSYDDVLPYFKKSEMNKNPDSVDSEYHGFEGPMTIETPSFDHPYKSGVEGAAKELGYDVIDTNGKYSKGFYNYQTNSRNGQRCSVAKAYLVPSENRPNLDIVKNAFVTKVIIESQTAEAVEFEHGGKTHVVKASREVILSAGTVNSAQLLMLSGIGPKEHLEEIGIPVIADLPVGLNFQDHSATAQLYYTDKLPTAYEELLDPRNIALYIGNRSGIYTAPEGIQYIAFSTIDPNTPSTSFPDYQLYFMDGVPLIIRLQTNMKPEHYESVFAPYELKSQLWCVSSILHPKSRGTVKLSSADPHASPLIDPNYFADPEDLTDIVAGLKECDRVINASAMSSLDLKPFRRTLKGCEMYAENQEEYLTCFARSFIVTLSHQVGTAKMGNPDDPTTVVDPQLRVKTIQNLRVVDASVMPIVPAGNTNNPTIMVAEKAADIIKETIQCNSSATE